MRPLLPSSVHFEILTNNDLRKINLTLTNAQENEREEWNIDLEVSERNRTSPFQLVGKIAVRLGPEDFEGARTISKVGLCPVQRAQTLHAADALKAHRDGELTIDHVRDAVTDIVRVE